VVARGTGEPVQKEARACIRQDAVAIVPEPIEADGPATVVHYLINVGSAAAKQRLLQEYRHNSAFNVTLGCAAVKPQSAFPKCGCFRVTEQKVANKGSNP
jgi:hypothetical protein